ncbi:MAG: M23 family metallopeptidase [Actinomycetota bacterium]|nr:M23 family metallopeptidase [Actinomycetota bacterium]
MRGPARLALAVVVLMGAFVALPRPASRFVAPDASAQVPTPTIPDLLSSPKPTSSPSEDPDPGGGGGGGGGGGEEDPNGGGGGNNTGGDEDPDGDGKGGDGKDGGDAKKGDRKAGGKRPGETLEEKRKRLRRKKRKQAELMLPPPRSIAGRIPGAFDTSKLVATAIRLRSLGMSQEDVVAKVYPPFIIAGNASWLDTWHAYRYGPAPGQIRLHEGQDVFCDLGDPILAPEAGTISMSNGGLGGLTARVHRPDGRYWYMTHLSALNRSFRNGDAVQVGDVVGYCGNSGNAATTPPHVHFGFYGPDGDDPKNPMKYLVQWLRAAETRVLGVVNKTDKKRQKQYESGAITAARRFGDGFVPDRSELTFAGESLWATGSSPASGAFGLAEAALQEALSTNGLELGILPTPVDLQLPQSEGRAVLDPSSALAQMLEEATHDHTEGSD